MKKRLAHALSCTQSADKFAMRLSRTMVTPTSTSRPRRFAPLGQSKPNTNNAPKLRGVIFDVDGTLCLPQNYMFKDMRAALGIPKSVDILEHILALSNDPTERGNASSSPQSQAQEAIKKIEREAMKHQQPQPGLNELITYLASKELRLALCTRNFEMPVKHLLEKFVDEEARNRFHPLITREAEGVKPKPSPEGIWACVQAWSRVDLDAGHQEGVSINADRDISTEDKVKSCEGVIMVGDSVDDIEAGARAGAATVLLVNEDNRHLLESDEWPKRVDLSISSLDELAEVLEKGFEGRS